MKEDKYAPIQQETPGMVSPDKPKIKKNKKTVLVFFAVAFVAIVFAGLFECDRWDFSARKPCPFRGSTDFEMQLKQLLEERRAGKQDKDARRRKRKLADKYGRDARQRVEPLQRQVEELESIRNEIELRREMANLVVVREEERKKNGPRKGRTARPSYSLNLPNITKGRQLASSERIEPKFSKAKSPTGQMIKGRL